MIRDVMQGESRPFWPDLLGVCHRWCLGAVTLTVAASLGLGWSSIEADAAFPQIQLDPISTGHLQAPVGLVNAGDGSGRLFTVDQRGKIEILQDGGQAPSLFLDIESKLVPERNDFDERGLLGLAFHPNFGQSGAVGEDKFYVYYSAQQPAGDPDDPVNPVDHQSVIAEYALTSPGASTADAGSERILMTFDQPQFNHDAGQIAFGPDGYLYIASGDGGGGGDNEPGHTGGGDDNPTGGRGNAQDRTNLLGKILRIDVDGNNGPGGQYGIPTSNPFVGEGNGVREEILAFGLRNPWRFSFDDGPGGSGDMFIADVGQGDVEEINVFNPADVQAGKGVNFGWKVREGEFDFDTDTPFDDIVDFTDPVAQYIHPNSDPNAFPGLAQIGLSVTGGFVYRGSEFPELVGKYIFADWSNLFGTADGTLLGLEEVAPGQWELSILDVLGGNPIGLYITALGEDEDGELYVVARSNLAPSGLDPVTNGPGGQILKIAVVPEPGTIVLVIGALNFAFALRKHRSSIML